MSQFFHDKTHTDVISKTHVTRSGGFDFTSETVRDINRCDHVK